MKAEFHIHTKFSKCSNLKFENLLKALKKKEIKIITICDHNETKGAIEFKKYLEKKGEKNIKVIIGEEIETKEGEIIGIFLKRKINKLKTLKETAKEIIKQNGVIIIPHPFDDLRRKSVKENITKVLEFNPLIEVFNSRVIFKKKNKQAKEFCEKNGLIPIIGSDAHTYKEIGNAIIEIDDFEDPKDFLKKIKKAKFHPKKNNALNIIKSVLIKKVKKVFKK